MLSVFPLLASCFTCYSKSFCSLIINYYAFVAESLKAYVRNQVEAYHNARVQCGRPYSGLAWWQEHEKLWALVAIIARHRLCVPASSASSERSFSKTGHIMRSRRSRLSDAHVKELSFISWNVDLCGTGGSA